MKVHFTRHLGYFAIPTLIVQRPIRCFDIRIGWSFTLWFLDRGITFEIG